MLNNWYRTVVILTAIAKPSCAKLYKQTKFPIKDTTSTTYREEINAMSKVQCASNCGIDTVNCKAFNFYPSTSTCQYINFVYALPSVASSSQHLSGYVENGLFRFFPKKHPTKHFESFLLHWFFFKGWPQSELYFNQMNRTEHTFINL